MMNSSSGVSSFGYSNQYTFSNLPSFATSRRSTDKNESLDAQSQSQAHTHGQTQQQQSHPHDKVGLPFLPTRRFPVDDEFFSRLPSGPDTAVKSEGRRVWSAGSDRGRLFSQRRSYVEKEEETVDPQAEFVKLGHSVVSLLYVLGKKSGLWVLWMLNVVFSVLVGKVKRIPDPSFDSVVEEKREKNAKSGEEKEEKEKEADVGVAFAESTPVKNTDEKTNPLFYKKLRGIKESLQDKLERAGNDENSVVKREDGKYGTHFFSKPEKGVNLEACFMKSSMQERPIVSEDDLYTKAETIRNDLMQLSQLPEQVLTVSKPSFTRSTKRFEDLEWLVDEQEDYLNNLESTRLYQEYQKILAERKKMRQLVELSKMKESAPVRGLSREQILEVEQVWEEPPSGVLMKKYGVNIEARDIATLADRHWLNDNIIDFYMQLIRDDIVGRKLCTMHVFSTFFYTNLKSKGYDGVRRWAKRAKIDVSELDYIFVPMNLNGTHWALSVVDNIRERFIYVDSLFSDGTDALEMLVDYMKAETRRVHGDGMNGKNYDLYTLEGRYECPGQDNGFDCGVFACTAVDYIARGLPLSYSQKDMSLIRRRMAWEIMHAKVVDR